MINIYLADRSQSVEQSSEQPALLPLPLALQLLLEVLDLHVSKVQHLHQDTAGLQEKVGVAA
jgi:hypothetical protein